MSIALTLLPDGDGISSSNWVAVGETNRHQCLDDNNGDTSYVKCSTDTDTMIITYADPSVAEADIDTITSVRFLSSGRSNDRRNAALVDIGFQTPSGNVSTSCSYNAHVSSHETINGATKIYSDGLLGGTDWTYSDLENLEMICTKDGTQTVFLGYLALKVIYEPAVSADNATFFGANF